MQGRTLTFSEIEARTRRFADAFSGHGPGVLIALPQGPDAYAAMLGAGLAGCYYAPLNVAAPVDRLCRIARLMRPTVIVAAAELAGALAAAVPGAALVSPYRLDDKPYGGSGVRHELAYLIFTSGTTGLPKGVMIPRTALDHYIDWVSRSGFITSHDRVAQFSNIAFDVSVTDIYGALGLGAELFPVTGRADRMFPARLVARERLTVWNSTPSVIGLMMQAGEADQDHLRTLRLVNTCGEPLLPAHVETLFAALPEGIVQNSYGPTETTVTMTEIRLDRHRYREACDSSVAIGAPIADMGIHLVGGPHPDEGEIAITGPQLASGYWEDPEKTAAAFRALLVDGRETRAYFSGDWAIRRDGHIFFKQRMDGQVKVHGHRLELDEVARAIHDHGFPIVCVLKWRGELAAVIERRSDRPFVEADLRSAMAKHLERHAIPSTIRVIEHMPHTENDKLDRRAVAEWLDAVAGI